MSGRGGKKEGEMAIISTMLTPLQQNKKKIEEGGDDGSGSELIIQEFFSIPVPSLLSFFQGISIRSKNCPPPSSSSSFITAR